MTEYRVLQTSDLAAEPEQATRKCARCPNHYTVPCSIFELQCLCGSRTLYPINDADPIGGKAWALG